MRGTTHSMFLLSTVLLTACKGDGAGDSGNGIVYPQGCIQSSTGASFRFIADAIAASPDGASLTLCPGTFEETVEIRGKEITLVGDPQTLWSPPTNQPALIVGDQADVTIRRVDVESSRNGFEVDNASLTVETVTFSELGNYAVEGTDSQVTMDQVIVTLPGWGGAVITGNGWGVYAAQNSTAQFLNETALDIRNNTNADMISETHSTIGGYGSGTVGECVEADAHSICNP